MIIYWVLFYQSLLSPYCRTLRPSVQTTFLEHVQHGYLCGSKELLWDNITNGVFSVPLTKKWKGKHFHGKYAAMWKCLIAKLLQAHAWEILTWGWERAVNTKDAGDAHRRTRTPELSPGSKTRYSSLIVYKLDKKKTVASLKADFYMTEIHSIVFKQPFR